MEIALIDLNMATAEQLDAIKELEGHGFEIVSYRGERGRFDEVRQLEEVPGLAGKWNGAEASLRVSQVRDAARLEGGAPP